MKSKTKRCCTLLLGAIGVAVGVIFVLQAFQENLLFFYTPSEFKAKKTRPLEKIRLGGLVQEGSVVQKGNVTRFHLTDLAQSLPVAYQGILPDLFREGQGVVVEGHWLVPQEVFQARIVFAKHDENYRPPGTEKIGK